MLLVFLLYEGLVSLLPAIAKFHSTLKTLNLSRTGVSSKSISKLAEVLMKHGGFYQSLIVLDLSENSLKGEELSVRLLCIYVMSD
jgi:Ran GTPase-activating protein (RanGAP) involved in mRNA processing and transport